LGQVGEQVPQLGVRVTQPAGLTRPPSQGLHHREGDQLRVGDLRSIPTFGRSGARSG
jgi:hypothetical protein